MRRGGLPASRLSLQHTYRVVSCRVGVMQHRDWDWVPWGGRRVQGTREAAVEAVVEMMMVEEVVVAKEAGCGRVSQSLAWKGQGLAHRVQAGYCAGVAAAHNTTRPRPRSGVRGRGGGDGQKGGEGKKREEGHMRRAEAETTPHRPGVRHRDAFDGKNLGKLL